MSNENSKEDSDRRRAGRVDLKTTVKYSLVTPSFESALIRNISSTGLCILINRKLPEGSVLRVEFQLPGDKPENIEALARVVWQRQEGEDLLTGVKFLS